MSNFVEGFYDWDFIEHKDLKTLLTSGRFQVRAEASSVVFLGTATHKGLVRLRAIGVYECCSEQTVLFNDGVCKCKVCRAPLRAIPSPELIRRVSNSDQHLVSRSDAVEALAPLFHRANTFTSIMCADETYDYLEKYAQVR